MTKVLSYRYTVSSHQHQTKTSPPPTLGPSLDIATRRARANTVSSICQLYRALVEWARTPRIIIDLTAAYPFLLVSQQLQLESPPYHNMFDLVLLLIQMHKGSSGNEKFQAAEGYFVAQMLCQQRVQWCRSRLTPSAGVEGDLRGRRNGYDTHSHQVRCPRVCIR